MLIRAGIALLCIPTSLHSYSQIAGKIPHSKRYGVKLVTSSASGQTNVLLYKQSGQSNSPGRAAADAPNEVTVPDSVLEYRPDLNTTQHLQDPTGQPSGGGVYTVATVRSMNPNLGKVSWDSIGIKTVIVATGKGNTEIDQWTTPGSVLFDSAKTWFRRLVTFGQSLNWVPEKYEFWVQGENDADVPLRTPTDGYVELLSTYCDMMTDSINLDKLFYSRIGYISANSVDTPFTEAIMKAQSILNLSKDEIILTTDTAAAFSLANGYMKSDNVHYTVKGLNTIGKWDAHAVDTFRRTGKKVYVPEIVSSLMPPVGYFDDIYNFRSLKVGLNADFKEMFGRNNLTHTSGTGLSFNGGSGLIDNGTPNPLEPASVRSLTNAFNWTIEITLKANSGHGMLINGRSADWNTDWLNIVSNSSFELKGNGVTKTVSSGNIDFSQVGTLSLCYSTLTGLKVYWNCRLITTVTDWAFTSFSCDAFLRSNGTTPDGSNAFNGTVERIRIVKDTLLQWMFDRSPNIPFSTRAIEGNFGYAGTIAEANNNFTCTVRAFSGGAIVSPSYDADGIVLDETNYIRLASPRIMTRCTIETRLKIASDATGFECITGPLASPNVGGFGGGISIDWPENLIFFGTGTTGNVSWPVTGITYTNFNIYKFVWDGASVELFINGVSQGTKSISGTMRVYTIGARHSGQSNLFKGTIDYFNITNN